MVLTASSRKGGFLNAEAAFLRSDIREQFTTPVQVFEFQCRSGVLSVASATTVTTRATSRCFNAEAASLSVATGSGGTGSHLRNVSMPKRRSYRCDDPAAGVPEGEVGHVSMPKRHFSHCHWTTPDGQ